MEFDGTANCSKLLNCPLLELAPGNDVVQPPGEGQQQGKRVIRDLRTLEDLEIGKRNLAGKKFRKSVAVDSSAVNLNPAQPVASLDQLLAAYP